MKEDNVITVKLPPDIDKVVSVRLSLEERDMLDKVFIDSSSDSDKVRYVIREYSKFIETFPYLNANQKTMPPQDAGFPPCDFCKALYDEGQFVGFHCLLRKPPFNLPSIRVGKLTLKATTSEICWTCVEVCKKSKLGINLIGQNVTLEQLNLHKEKKQIKAPESLVTKTLTREGLRMDYEKAKAVFDLLKHNNISRVSKKLGISRPTIYKLLKVFPEGVR